MIDTEDFINNLVIEGYTHLCVVPCSFAKNLINGSINGGERLEYLPCASEAVACSVAAGIKMSGKRPIVIVQSSGLTNMGSCITSLLKPYEVTFPIIVSWRTYKDGDSEIQHKHLATHLPDLVEAYGYKSEVLVSDKIKVIDQILSAENEQKILLLRSGFFSEVVLDKKHQLNLTRYISRSEYLKRLDSLYKDSEYTFVGTTGNTAREMYSFMPNTSNFYMAGNMGGALSVGLGAYLAEKKIIVCGGDAEYAMHLGGITTAARYASNLKGKLIYIVFDNESNKSTGGQKSYQEHINYLGVGKAVGLKCCGKTIHTILEFEKCAVINGISSEVI